MAKQSKKREAKLRVKSKNLKYFDAKLRLALFASLRSAIIIDRFVAILIKIHL